MIYTFRYTPYEQTLEDFNKAYDDLEMFFNEQLAANEWVLSQEKTKNFHFHAVFSLPEKLNRKMFKEQLYDYMKVPKEHQGNACFSIQEVRERKKSLSYCTKDGVFKHYPLTGSWAQEVQEAYSVSKKKPQSYKDTMEDLYLRFKEDKLNTRSLWIEIALARAEFKLPINVRQISEVVTSYIIRKDPKKAVELWENNIGIKQNG